MPLILEDVIVEQVQPVQQSVTETVAKVEYPQVHGSELLWIFLAFAVVYIFRVPLLNLLMFSVKGAILLLFVYCSYILFFV